MTIRIAPAGPAAFGIDEPDSRVAPVLPRYRVLHELERQFAAG